MMRLVLFASCNDKDTEILFFSKSLSLLSEANLEEYKCYIIAFVSRYLISWKFQKWSLPPKKCMHLARKQHLSHPAAIKLNTRQPIACRTICKKWWDIFLLTEMSQLWSTILNRKISLTLWAKTLQLNWERCRQDSG